MILSPLFFPGRPKNYWSQEGKPRYYEPMPEHYILIDGDKDKELKATATDLNLAGYLEEIAGEINEDYYDSKFRWMSIKFAFGQRRLWGNCKVSTIRINYRVLAIGKLEGDFDKALEYLLTHEMCHLTTYGHDVKFWRLVDKNPISREGYSILMKGKRMPCTDGSINYVF